MRVGLIADIHGNLVALDAVLFELAREHVDQLVCLGDVAVLGPQPREVVARLQDLACPCVLGNTDAWLLPDPPLLADGPSVGPMTDLNRWTAAQLGPNDFAFLRRLPPTVDLMLSPDLTMHCFHASSRSLDDVIAATTPIADLDAMGISRQPALFAGGHTHVQLVRRHGEAHIINPGSVGLPGVGPGVPDLPVNHAVAWAEYAVVSVTDGSLGIKLRRIPIDLEKILTAAAASGMPHLDWWTSKWRHNPSP
ncbi:MAG: metallophosphoesterase family protein [Thermomicrobiales bacterium]